MKPVAGGGGNFFAPPSNSIILAKSLGEHEI